MDTEEGLRRETYVFIASLWLKIFWPGRAVREK